VKTEFTFDGERLHIRMIVEDKYERAWAEMLESYNIASVTVDRERDYGYSPAAAAKAVNIVLRRPEGHRDSDV